MGGGGEMCPYYCGFNNTIPTVASSPWVYVWLYTQSINWIRGHNIGPQCCNDLLQKVLILTGADSQELHSTVGIKAGAPQLQEPFSICTARFFFQDTQEQLR